MLDRLLNWDEEAFLVINRDWVSPILDWILVPARNPLTWVPVYAFLILFLTINFKKQGWIAIGMVILCFIVTDQLSGQVIKPWFERVRPCNDSYLADYVRQLVPCGSGYSFTSNHASNHFGISVMLMLLIGRLAWWVKPALLLWAALVAYAQVYVGLHYPIDVLSGALLGTLSAMALYYLLRRKINFIS